jgi:hypothetical protein
VGNDEDIRLLLDTNIGIQLEELETGSGKIRESFKRFSELCHRHGVKLFHHPDSKLDIGHDKNVDRQRATKSRFGKYPPLPNVPHGEVSELEDLFMAIDGPNDLVDCQILYAVHRDCIEYLISEDVGLHKRASYSGLNERVFTIEEAIKFLLKHFSEEPFAYPHSENVSLSGLDIADPFFDSLKEDYKAFPEWFAKMQKKGERGWIIKENDELAGICIVEDKGVGKLPYRQDHRTLKACTFKISRKFTGQKYGELLLKTLFSHCIYNNYDLVYLTTFPKQAPLVYVLRDFGFLLGPKPRENGELELFKTFTPAPADHPRVDPLVFAKTWFPYYYDDKTIPKYVIPIQPQYHDILFPEVRPNPPLFEDTSRVPPGNTIKKAYLCHSPTKSLEKGSLILFYRSRPDQKITTLAIVEETKRFTDLPELLKMVGKRSVYTIKEMKEMLKKETMVIKFRLLKHISKQFDLGELKRTKVLKDAPISITSIAHKDYLKLKINPGK